MDSDFEKDNNVCPCCGRHCSTEDLHCSRGRAHFGMETEPESGNEHHRHHHHSHERSHMTVDDKVIALLRGCGHYLHHNMSHDSSSEQMLLFLTEEDKRELILLLKKCLKNWNKE